MACKHPPSEIKKVVAVNRCARRFRVFFNAGVPGFFISPRIFHHRLTDTLGFLQTILLPWQILKQNAYFAQNKFLL